VTHEQLPLFILKAIWLLFRVVEHFCTFVDVKSKNKQTYSPCFQI